MCLTFRQILKVLDSEKHQGFPDSSAGKESARNAGELSWEDLPWVGKIPWRRERLLTPVFWPGEFHGLYGPQGCKESDTIE